MLKMKLYIYIYTQFIRRIKPKKKKDYYSSVRAAQYLKRKLTKKKKTDNFNYLFTMYYVLDCILNDR